MGSIHLADLVNDNLDTPTRIGAVRVEGATHTRESFLASLIQSRIPPPDQTSTLGTVLRTTRDISHLLHRTDIFQTVNVQLERSREALAAPNDVDVIFTTKERGKYFLKTSTEVGNNEGNASATARVRNVFGGAETFEANASVGTKTRRSIQASLSAPVTSTLRTRGDLSIFALDRDYTTYASCTEAVRGVKAGLKHGEIWSGQHELAYEAVLRHIGSLLPSASVSIRESAGQTIKSSITHSWTQDTRSGPSLSIAPGHYTKLFHELAGIGGDAHYYKAEAESKITTVIAKGMWLSCSARAGGLYNLSPTGQSLFSDRFQLGGPLSLRMFRANGMGPRDGVDSLGGDYYWAAGLSLISNLPPKPHWPLKAHFFLNAGQLQGSQPGISLRDTLATCVSKPSISAGVGLIYLFDPIRVELNFGVPLVASKSDGLRKGIQVGMGLEFL
ncbi:uncharacterized protein STEHIDRAFT_171771 [Stereum hirsutum FP-91666 SS1]|uniref:uncharacterized protein n=1 Tax=Stereum hirsutum (strain FP-91666) TaxID=721885 RepID=UPI000444A0A6|nr:uncharacterized protein STEHIDRAFT_171771 [Stereum hirsutum FP-91666 SS1]EIM81386.1 hypothetical protein STEHIDRAFT_171771 [Stereum hirsutum FP-91666 SS1]